MGHGRHAGHEQGRQGGADCDEEAEGGGGGHQDAGESKVSRIE